MKRPNIKFVSNRESGTVLLNFISRYNFVVNARRYLPFHGSRWRRWLDFPEAWREEKTSRAELSHGAINVTKSGLSELTWAGKRRPRSEALIYNVPHRFSVQPQSTQMGSTNMLNDKTAGPLTMTGVLNQHTHGSRAPRPCQQHQP